jgi:hypothetical protein
MPNFVDSFKHYGNIFGKGLMEQLVPGMAAGLIVNLFQEWHVDVAKVTSDVQNNRSLWAELKDEQKQQLSYAAQRSGSLDFITPEFFINAIKKDFPGVASLVINWEPAMKWLTEQLEDIKSRIQD